MHQPKGRSMEILEAPHPAATATRPRIGFLGVGWIGRHRLEAIAREEGIEVAAIADPARDLAEAAREAAPEAALGDDLDDLLEADLDAVVIATPNALHAEQSVRALEAGLAVFCQKPLGRTAEETTRVVDAARRADRLLGVDLSYRHVEGLRLMRDLVQQGDIGDVFAADLVFHNAYGPGKPWFFDPRLAGGGCVIDLGIHLVDLAFWLLGRREPDAVSARLFAGGAPLADPSQRVEDYAVARLDLEGGAVVNLACSWNLSAGRNCAIEVALHGTSGGLRLSNVGGSYVDFVTERFRGTARETLAEPPDDWGGRAAVDWARRLARSRRFDPAIEEILPVAQTLDAIYGR